MHENSKARMIFRYFVDEEGLELPEELINEMESRIIEAHLHEFERIQMAHKRHGVIDLQRIFVTNIVKKPGFTGWKGIFDTVEKFVS